MGVPEGEEREKYIRKEVQVNNDLKHTKFILKF